MSFFSIHVLRFGVLLFLFSNDKNTKNYDLSHSNDAPIPLLTAVYAKEKASKKKTEKKTKNSTKKSKSKKAPKKAATSTLDDSNTEENERENRSALTEEAQILEDKKKQLDKRSGEIKKALENARAVLKKTETLTVDNFVNEDGSLTTNDQYTNTFQRPFWVGQSEALGTLIHKPNGRLHNEELFEEENRLAIGDLNSHSLKSNKSPHQKQQHLKEALSKSKFDAENDANLSESEKIKKRFAISKADYRDVVIAHTAVTCVDVILKNIKTNKYLLIQRANRPVKGQYWMIVGRLLRGETFSAAAKRKVAEEIGISEELVSVSDRIIGTYNTLFDDSGWRKEDNHSDQKENSKDKNIVSAPDEHDDDNDFISTHTVNIVVTAEVNLDFDESGLSTDKLHSDIRWVTEAQYLNKHQESNPEKSKIHVTHYPLQAFRDYLAIDKNAELLRAYEKSQEELRRLKMREAEKMSNADKSQNHENSDEDSQDSTKSDDPETRKKSERIQNANETLKKEARKIANAAKFVKNAKAAVEENKAKKKEQKDPESSKIKVDQEKKDSKTNSKSKTNTAKTKTTKKSKSPTDQKLASTLQDFMAGTLDTAKMSKTEMLELAKKAREAAKDLDKIKVEDVVDESDPANMGVGITKEIKEKRNNKNNKPQKPNNSKTSKKSNKSGTSSKSKNKIQSIRDHMREAKKEDYQARKAADQLTLEEKMKREGLVLEEPGTILPDQPGVDELPEGEGEDDDGYDL